MTDRATRNSILAGLLVLLVLAVVGGLLINAFIERERERDLLEWESRLGLAAESRAEAVARLVAKDRRSLDELAANASLQAYLAVLVRGAGGDEGGEPAEQGYLRNLLVTAAARDGWSAEGPRVAADVPAERVAGLALLAPDGRVVVQTGGLAALAPLLAAVPAAGAAFRETPDGVPVLVYATPVRGVLGSSVDGAAEAVGRLVGIRSPAVDLYPLLARGPSFAEDGEALLLQAAGDGVLYLSPTRDGFGDLHRSVPLVRARLAEAAAVREPGGFVTLADHSGRTVLQASRPVRGQPWVVAQQVDAGQALALADERRGFLLLALGLLLVAMLALAVSAWRHGSSVRAQQQAAAFRAQAEELARQTELLNAIAANTDALTVLVDRGGRVRFANRAAAELASVPVGALTGQPLGAVLPAGLAAELAALGIAAAAAGVPQRQVVALADGAATAAGRRFQASAIPVAVLGTERDLVLHVLQDVTELEATRRRHDDLLRDLVAALVRAVERHDPFAAEHAGRVAEVADALARELGLADAERESLELAATLANVGKVTLPAALLAKTGPLDEAERAELRSHVQRSLDLLQGLPFEGPVLELIAQKQEHVDGSGYPRGLSGDALSLPGRILAVANAFVALASARAYRDGVPLREAAAALLADADTRYDRGVVAALLHVIENRRDWSAWETSRRR